MTGPASKRSSPVGAQGRGNAPTYDECKRAEAATKTRWENETAKVAQLQARYDDPDPSATPETLAQLKKDIELARGAEHLAKINYGRAATALAEAEKVAGAEQVARESDVLAKRTDEIVRTMPGEFRKAALKLIEMAADMSAHDKQVAELNKKRIALGLEPLPPSEDLMRRIPGTADQTIEDEIEVEHYVLAEGQVPNADTPRKMVREKKKRRVYGRMAIIPTPYASVLEIAGFAPGEAAYRVPGSYAPVGIWIDACGIVHPRGQ